MPGGVPTGSRPSTVRRGRPVAPALGITASGRQGALPSLPARSRAFSLTLAAFCAGWVVFALLGATWWQLLTAALRVLSTQVAFLGHDAGHKQVARTSCVSYLMGLLLGNLAVQLSFGWWLDKHNRHHAHPNHAELDPDVEPAGPLVFLRGQDAGRRGLVA